MTDHSKLDAALASALADVTDPDARVLPVFVGLVEASAEARAALARVGASDPSGLVATASLSARDVAELSEQPWVRYLRLSGRMDLLD